MRGLSRKVCFFFSVIILGVGHLSAQENSCDEIPYYLSQLSVNCKGIAGKLVAPVKEFRTKKVLPGMSYGQCSGSFAYTNPFIKFYSQLLPESASEAKWNAWREALVSCLIQNKWTIISDVTLAINMRNIRWELPEKGFRYIIILEEKPDPDNEGTIITVELIRTVF